MIGDKWWHLLPAGVSGDAVRILAARGLRAFADGYVALLLPIYFLDLGFGPLAIGALIAAALVGSALLTLWVGFAANRHSRRRLLIAGALLMVVTGLAFSSLTGFWPLLLVAVIGTINPTAGDSGVFQPLEYTVLSQSIDPAARTALFARYSVIGSLAGSIGVLTAATPDFVVSYWGWERADCIRAMFGLYAAMGVISALLYRPLSPHVERATEDPVQPLGPSKRLVYGLAALFAMDSLGTGFLVQSMLTLWLYQNFQISVGVTAAILFWSGVFSSVSYLVAVPLAKRIGLINTMVYTHLPSNILLVLVPFAPDLTIAIALLLARGALSQMDVPTRASYVMAVVSPAERPAAASLTAVPKTFAWAAGSMVSGYLLSLSTFGWPLVIGGIIKSVYDILLLLRFRRVRPPEEDG
jgi:MFS family permease